MISGFVEPVLKILRIFSKAMLLFLVLLSFGEVACCVSSGFQFSSSELLPARTSDLDSVS